MQKWYKNFPYVVHPDSPDVSILLHLLYYSVYTHTHMRTRDFPVRRSGDRDQFKVKYTESHNLKIFMESVSNRFVHQTNIYRVLGLSGD